MLYDAEAPNNSSNPERLDAIISLLFAVRGAAAGTLVRLVEADIVYVVNSAKRAFLDRPALLRLNPPVNICGDVHGQYYDLLRVLELVGGPPDQRYLFLGDYVDRGPQSMEVIVLLMALRLRHPDSVYLLRGNHESALLNKNYGFYKELERRGYSHSLQRRFADCFNCMPLAAIVGGRIFCCHGGLSPELSRMEQIDLLPRPSDVPRAGLFCDLLWADPEYVRGWVPNVARGCSYLFGPDVVDEFLRTHDFDLICRAHQVVEDGYELFAQRGLVTVFSAPNYSKHWCCNAGAVMNVSPELTCSFVLFKEDKDGAEDSHHQSPAEKPTQQPGNTEHMNV